MKKKFVVILAVVFAVSVTLAVLTRKSDSAKQFMAANVEALAAYECGSGGSISFGRMCSQTGTRGTLPMVLCSRCPNGTGYFKADYVAFCRNGR